MTDAELRAAVETSVQTELFRALSLGVGSVQFEPTESTEKFFAAALRHLTMTRGFPCDDFTLQVSECKGKIVAAPIDAGICSGVSLKKPSPFSNRFIFSTVYDPIIESSVKTTTTLTSKIVYSIKTAPFDFLHRIEIPSEDPTEISLVTIEYGGWRFERRVRSLNYNWDTKCAEFNLNLPTFLSMVDTITISISCSERIPELKITTGTITDAQRGEILRDPLARKFIIPNTNGVNSSELLIVGRTGISTEPTEKIPKVFTSSTEFDIWKLLGTVDLSTALEVRAAVINHDLRFTSIIDAPVSRRALAGKTSNLPQSVEKYFEDEKLREACGCV